MELKVAQGNIVEMETDCIVVNLFQDVTEPGGATGAVDQAMDGAIRRLIADRDFTGERDSTAMLYTYGRLPSPRVLIVGLGKQEQFDLQGVRRAAGVAAQALKKVKGVQHYATIVHGGGDGGFDAMSAAQAVAEGTLLATYQIKKYQRETPEPSLHSCTVVEFSGEKIDQVRRGVHTGEVIARAVHTTRDLVNEPANVLTPAELAHRACTLADSVGLKTTVLGEAAMRELGMNILLGVSQGSEQEAQLVVLEHAPSGVEDDKPIVLVGKGITFDTGGISIKPSQEMWRMKDDMGGAAAVIGAMEAVVRLNLPRRVIGVAVCVENMPDGKAYRPGDVLTGITGKTTEIISTDAEGRLVLADALGYVARFDPAAVIDLATLTGSVGIALGKIAAAVCANDETLQQDLLDASKRSGERLWPMPMYDEYKDLIKSDVAEVKNSGGRYGGVSIGAKFLEHFTEGYPWAHLDIASVVLSDNNNDPIVPKGATGFGVRLLVELLAAS
jgi:leucyl aminopeptidase